MGIYSDELFPIAEQYAETLNQLGDVASRRMEQRIIESYEELLEEIEDNWDAIAQNKSIIPQQQRLLLAEELGEVLQVIRPGVSGRELERILEEAVRDAAGISDRYYQAVQSVVNPNEFIRQQLQATTGVPLDALRNQVSDGMRRLYRHGEDQASKISAIVENGLIQNRSVRAVRDDIESTLKLSRYQAERIARTEIMGSFGGGAIGRAIEDGALIQWITFKDEYVCSTCSARNMRVFRPQDITYPVHPMCRCNMVVVYEDWLDDDDIIDASDREFMAQHRQEGLDTLRAAGKTPNYGAGPFDEGEAPKPLWSPPTIRSAQPSPEPAAQRRQRRPRRTDPIIQQQSVEPIRTDARSSSRRTSPPSNIVRNARQARAAYTPELRRQLGDDEATLSFFTGDRFQEINRALRTNAISDSVQGEIRRINNALDKLPAYQGVVYRGLTPKTLGQIDDLMAQFKPGEDVTFPGFTSASMSENIARNYAGFNGIGGVTVAIKSNGRNGRAIAPISRNPQEQEVLFKSNTRFRVVKVEEGLKEGIRSAIVVLEEVD